MAAKIQHEDLARTSLKISACMRRLWPVRQAVDERPLFCAFATFEATSRIVVKRTLPIATSDLAVGGGWTSVPAPRGYIAANAEGTSALDIRRC
jgi:hypothetical protein